MTRATPSSVLALASWLVTAACGQDVQDRPSGTYSGSFRAPPVSGGGSGDDGGVGDGGVLTRDVFGRVVGVDDLGESVGRFSGVANRRVAGYDPAGDLVAAVSDADGNFGLEGLTRSTPLILSASGDPPSFVVLERSRLDAPRVPVIDAAFLEEVAATVSTAPADVNGHAFLWLEDGGGAPVRGLGVEVLSGPPLEGPFYATTDTTQLTGEPPTDGEALVVLLNVVAGTLELSIFRLDAPAMSETITVPVDAGVVTFYEVTTGL